MRRERAASENDSEVLSAFWDVLLFTVNSVQCVSGNKNPGDTQKKRAINPKKKKKSLALVKVNITFLLICFVELASK